jgi:hypothetical protein
MKISHGLGCAPSSESLPLVLSTSIMSEKKRFSFDPVAALSDCVVRSFKAPIKGVDGDGVD